MLTSGILFFPETVFLQRFTSGFLKVI